MSATEDDTELRDLLIQNLENNGVLNKLKAEMRAAVFLVMDEQDKVENKTPLVNENLKKCLNTKDGRLVASLIIDFLQIYHLDFTLAVFQPEINSLNGLDSREQVSGELGIQETDINRNTPLLLELIKRGRFKDKSSIFSEGDKATNLPKELSPRQIAEARKKFDIYEKDRTVGISKEDLKGVFGDLFPNFNKNMLERFVSDELHGVDKTPAKSVDFQEFLGLYKRLFNQCRSVVTHEGSDAVPNRLNKDKMSPLSASKGQGGSPSDTSLTSGSLKVKGQVHVPSRPDSEASGDNGMVAPAELGLGLELGLEAEEDAGEGDSFFDDPLPKPQKTYGCFGPSSDKAQSGAGVSDEKHSHKHLRPERGETLRDPSFPLIRRGASLNDLSALGSDTEGDGEHLLNDHDHSQSSVHRRAGGSPPASVSAAAPQQSVGGSLSGEGGHREDPGSRNATSNSKEKGLKDWRTTNDKTTSLLLDDDVDYDDDFNSHRSDISKSEVSIGEEIEEVSIEGPDNSDKFDEITQDMTVSQISQAADYIEDVA